MRKFYLVLFAFIILAGGCLDNRIDPELRQRIEEYYSLEQRGDWEKTYLFRTPAYRKTVPPDTYIMGMTRDMEGWRLDRYIIRDSRVRNKDVEVDISFVEHRSPEGTKTITQTTAWEKIDGIWYGGDVGSRIHLPLNEEIKEVIVVD